MKDVTLDRPGSANPKRGFPQPLPRPDNVPEPQDRPYPGTIKLVVDATDTARRIFHVRETIPVDAAGRMTLLYPEWLPGFHSPQAQIELMAGLVITAGGQKLAWRRDPINVYAFHVDVPEGAGEITASFQYLAPTDSSQGRVTVTREMLDLQWNTVVLHPTGYFARNIQMAPTAILPQGWRWACALDGRQEAAGIVFNTVPLDVLVDSPVYAGPHAARFALDHDVHLNIFADNADAAAVADQQVAACAQLTRQAVALFGARHYDRYEFLVALSEEVGANGVEHHRCCEIATKVDLFRAWDEHLTVRDVLAHEYVHSWNGKYRRGADSWQPCFNLPIRNSLMWVYEGLTQYLGQILCARAGLWTRQDLLACFADMVGEQMTRKGRVWRSLADTTRDPIVAERAPLPWTSWQRSEDYYFDGALIWLDADMIIRAGTGGQKSLDDFAQAFFGMEDRIWVTNTYDFQEVCAVLGQIHPHAWPGFFRDRLDSLSPQPPLGGIVQGGYELSFQDQPNHFTQSKMSLSGMLDLSHSIGLKVGEEGKVQECIWDSPAFALGITTGSQILAVNGRTYTHEELKRAVAQSGAGRYFGVAVRHGKHVSDHQFRYAGGHRYPHLVPASADPLLDRIADPRD